MPDICKECVHADIATETRQIKVRGFTLTQDSGGIICQCERVRNIWFTDGDMRCSEFERRAEDVK